MLKIKSPSQPPSIGFKLRRSSRYRLGPSIFSPLGLLFWGAIGIGYAFSLLILWDYLGFGLVPLSLWTWVVLAVLLNEWKLLPRRWNIWVGLACISFVVTGVLSYFAPGKVPLAEGTLGGMVGNNLSAGGSLWGIPNLVLLFMGAAVFFLPHLFWALAKWISTKIWWMLSMMGVTALSQIKELYNRFPLHRGIARLAGDLIGGIYGEFLHLIGEGHHVKAQDAAPAGGAAPEVVSKPVKLLPGLMPKRKAKEPGQEVSQEEQGPVSTSGPRAKAARGWGLPPITLLEARPEAPVSEGENLKKAVLIQRTLAEHNIEVAVEEIRPGPSVTLFGIVPGWVRRQRSFREIDKDGRPKIDKEGRPVITHVEDKTRVKVDAILAREKDISLAIAARSVRFEAPVPGESYVGLEVPNSRFSLVGLRQIMEDSVFQSLQRKGAKKGVLPIALGKGSGGESVVVDLAEMPHILIAGSTGSGKSVCINSILCCLLMQMSPLELRLLLIDPKRVELTPYNKLPHLLAPVVVEPERSAKMLGGLIQEMLRRYKLMEVAEVRNIEAYNLKVASPAERMPHIVTVIDELADMMMSATYEAEHALTRLAQLGRATGIHLIVATQRPSVDVVTGLIKANFPCRISFAVASQVDSRTILDTVGAEKLLGRGDMLFLPSDYPKPKRLQGVYVSDRETARVVGFWREQIGIKAAEIEIKEAVQEEEAVAGDEFLDQAKEMALKQGHISVSSLQRRLGIGYMRAARLVDQLEAQGILGDGEPGKSRPVIQGVEGDQGKNEAG